MIARHIFYILYDHVPNYIFFLIPQYYIHFKANYIKISATSNKKCIACFFLFFKGATWCIAKKKRESLLFVAFLVPKSSAIFFYKLK